MNASIFVNQDQEEQFNQTKNNFLKFMEDDLRDLLQDELEIYNDYVKKKTKQDQIERKEDGKRPSMRTFFVPK